MEKKSPEREPLKKVAGVKFLWTGRTPSKLREKEHEEPKKFLKKKERWRNKWSSFGIKRDGWALERASIPQLTRVPTIKNCPIPLWPRSSMRKMDENYFLNPNSSYSEGRWGIQPRNRGATERNIYQLLPSQEWRPSIPRRWPSNSSKWLTPFYCEWSLSHPTMTHPLSLTGIRGDNSPRRSLITSRCSPRESRGLRPHDLAQH